MMRYLFGFVVLTLTSLRTVAVHAQAQQLFQATCEEIDRMERYWNAKQKLPPFALRTDPVNGEEWIDFADGTGKRIKGKTGDAELVKVVYAQPLPVFPLRDTICIIDTVGSLAVKGILLNGHYYYVRKCLTRACRNEPTERGSMYVQSLRDVGDNRYLLFSFAGSGELYYSQFKLVNGKTEFHQSKIVPRNKPQHLE